MRSFCRHLPCADLRRLNTFWSVCNEFNPGKRLTAFCLEGSDSKSVAFERVLTGHNDDLPNKPFMLAARGAERGIFGVKCFQSVEDDRENSVKRDCFRFMPYTRRLAAAWSDLRLTGIFSFNLRTDEE